MELSLTDVMDKIVVDDWGQCKGGILGSLRRHVETGKLTAETLYGELGEIVAGKKPGREKEDEKKSPNPNRNRKNDWDDKREKMQAEMEAFSNEAADGAALLRKSFENGTGNLIKVSIKIQTQCSLPAPCWWGINSVFKEKMGTGKRNPGFLVPIFFTKIFYFSS